MQDDFKSEYLETNGIRLHYMTQSMTKGDGPLMLFLHGFPECWYSWRHQLREFGQDYQAVALDLRGYNKSDKPKETSAYALSELIKDVEGAIRALGYERCVLVGHDWGGVIAWAFADAHQEMLERLIVLNFPHPAKYAEGLKTFQQLRRGWYILLFKLPVLPELLLKMNDYAAIRSAFREPATHNPEACTTTDVDRLVDAAARPGAITGMLNYYRSIFGLKSFWNRDWEKLTVPTLMVWGEEDIALGKELTYGTEEYVKTLELHYIPECSHWVQQEQPELVNQYMRAFLARSL